MPDVNLQITSGATREQKQAVVREFTDTLVRVLHKRPEHIHIVIQDIEEQNWGFAGMLTDEYWSRQQPAPDPPAESVAGQTPRRS